METPTITIAASPTPTETPTVVWFPQTSTPTQKVEMTPTPTPDMKPGIGDVLFTDQFSENLGWEVFESSRGSVLFGKDELSIVVVEDYPDLSADTLVLTLIDELDVKAG